MTGKPASSSGTHGAWELRRGDLIAPGRHVIQRLAGGGAHETFLVDTGAGRAVAKLPRPRLCEDPHSLLRLQDEGRALVRLAHPAVPRHLDTVLSGPHPHLLLEYVPGQSLHAALAAYGSLSAPTVAAVGCALARALEHIARCGWVHLDVKPSNIVLNASPCLIDFELARPIAEAARMRRPAGTWAYMPPEQRIAGAPGAAPVGRPADVFALAASLVEAVTGLPYRSAPAALGTHLPGPLGALLGEALAPTPYDRPTAAELAAALADLAGPSALAA